MVSVLNSSWFDGHSPRAQACTLQIDGMHLVLRTTDQARRYPLRTVRWPERQRHGLRQTALPDGSLIQHADGAAWDAWCRGIGRRDSLVVRCMQSWRASVLALMMAIALVGSSWLWGVPWIGQTVAHAIPDAVQARIGARVMAQLEGRWLYPSQLPAHRQQALQERFQQAVARAYPNGDAPAWRLRVRHAPSLRANALALPGGDLVVTDELMLLLGDRPDALVGVLAHELGHVHHRDGLDMVVRASLVSALIGVVTGDASGFVGSVPATLLTQSYSREAERRADAYAAKLLHDAGLSPSSMVVVFERLAPAAEGEAWPPTAIASHPAPEERLLYFRHWQPGH